MVFQVILCDNVIKSQNTTSSSKQTFSCKGKYTGFYADVESNCQVYYTCDDHGNKFTYNCPKDTAFRQEALVCDHAHLVDCKKTEQFIEKIENDQVHSTDESQNSHERGELFRSFRIALPEPSRYLQSPKINNSKPTTFFMSSTVFLRESPNTKVRGNFIESITSEKYDLSTTPKSFDPEITKHNNNINNFDTFKQTSESKNLNIKNVFNSYSKDNENKRKPDDLKILENNDHSKNKKILVYTTTEKITTAGTEFPIPKFSGELSASPDYDPYYPKLIRTTDNPYIFKNTKINKSTFFSTKKPWSNYVNINIPDIIPDLNSLDDLVDRKKIFFIPRLNKL
ncbi:hypothetical protein HCN44_007765 [Aphidius gifuensis]|uniref:Chitin-binding type-2 domain-containing protein n=2 Tax=Aphidius gifuensis TaxID=684658 RepID=A0A835CNK8_APHGI|nr:hypothetical protein HCN44_007765 [Aphidius gifuensis]